MRRHHIQWEYRFWSDWDNLALIQSRYPALLGVYRSALRIQRADIARYCILDTYGGLYVDIDIYCLRPLDALIHPDTVTLASSPAMFGGETSYTNYLMYSPPGHRFWGQLLNEIQTELDKPRYWIRTLQVASSTGRNMLTGLVKRFPEVRKFDPHLVYNLNCPHNLDLLRQDPTIYCFHYGGTSRPLGGKKWGGNVGNLLAHTECKIKDVVGIRGNAYQVPVVSILLVIMIGLCIVNLAMWATVA